MNSPVMDQSVKSPAFVSTSTEEDKSIRLKLTGNADSEARETLSGVLDKTHDSLKSAAKNELVIELADLYFMNSSCLSIFVRWLSKIDGEYKVRFRCNPHLRWQRRSISMLSAFAPERVIIEP